MQRKRVLAKGSFLEVHLERLACRSAAQVMTCLSWSRSGEPTQFLRSLDRNQIRLLSKQRLRQPVIATFAAGVRPNGSIWRNLRFVEFHFHFHFKYPQLNNLITVTKYEDHSF